MLQITNNRARLFFCSFNDGRVPFRRHASLTSAIGRGIRRTQSNYDRLGLSRPPLSSNSDAKAKEDIGVPPRSRLDLHRRSNVGVKSTSRLGREQRSRERNQISQQAPPQTPYTTAGSEFIYGTSSVRAALEAQRRLFHKLYLWQGERSTNRGEDRAIFHLAKAKGVAVQLVAGASWDRMLFKMSDQRPHNGYVLEASTIPKLPVTLLGSMDNIQDDIFVQTALQSREERDTNKSFRPHPSGYYIPRAAKRSRYPLLLWLDRIRDTGNVGAIIRTAYFMGADAIILTDHGTAPISPVAIRASAGSAEYLPILIARQEIDFVKRSQENGWKFIAAVTPQDIATKQLQPNSFKADTVLEEGPCVLMVGNEGEGLRPSMQKNANHFMSITGAKGLATGVDSLNVSVAAALLIERLLSRTLAAEDLQTTNSRQ